MASTDRPADVSELIADEGKLVWWSSPSKWHWAWIIWEVIFPIALPTVVTFVIGLYILSAPSNMKMAIKIIFDFSPVTISFFSITLLATGLKRMWVKKQVNTGLFSASLGLAIAAGFSAGIFTLFRQSAPNETPNPYAYMISLTILLMTIRICHGTAKD